ncbi:MAG: cupin domain-containing protein [Hyphomonadaceae bacterium]
MRHILVIAAIAAAGCTTTPATPDQWLQGAGYAPVGNATSMDAAFLIGSPTQPGLYTIRVHLRDGGLMPPHSHPDDRMITVLSGTLYYGFGTTADPAGTTAYPTGATFFAKANDPHYAIGRGDVVYQESGMAPTGTRWVDH